MYIYIIHIHIYTHIYIHTYIYIYIYIYHQVQYYLTYLSARKKINYTNTEVSAKMSFGKSCFTKYFNEKTSI